MTSTEKDSTIQEPRSPFLRKFSKTQLSPEQQEQQRLGQEQYARRLSLNPFYRGNMTEEEAVEHYKHFSMGIIYYTEQKEPATKT